MRARSQRDRGPVFSGVHVFLFQNYRVLCNNYTTELNWCFLSKNKNSQSVTKTMLRGICAPCRQIGFFGFASPSIIKYTSFGALCADPGWKKGGPRWPQRPYSPDGAKWSQMVPDGLGFVKSDLMYCKTRTTVNGGFVVRWSLSSTPLTTRQNYRKNAYRSIFATVLSGLDPIGFVESCIPYCKNHTLRARGFVFCLCVCLFWCFFP